MSIFLKILGLINAFYLLSLHATNNICITGSSCNTVINSIYGNLLGVPIAAFGISLFIILLTIDLLKSNDNLSLKNVTNLNLLFLLPATAIGIILIAIQIIYIKAFCPFCTLNSLIILVLFILTFRDYQNLDAFEIKISVAQWLSIILVGIIPVIGSISSFNDDSNLNLIGTINGKEITINQLRSSEFKTDYLDASREVYQIQKQYFDSRILELVSKKNQMSINRYIQEKVISDVVVTDDEVKAFYEENINEIPKDKTFKDVSGTITQYLKSKKSRKLIDEHLKDLYKKESIQLLISLPDPIYVRENPYNTFSKGNTDAKIQIIEFADLECGACQKAHQSMKRILASDLKNKIYFEYRHFPIESHRYSKHFAKGSVCAGEQKKFFEFIDLTYANQRKLAKFSPEEFAKKLGLDSNQFKKCMTSDISEATIEQDILEAKRVGIQATPTFVINGQIFIGELTYNDLKKFL